MPCFTTILFVPTFLSIDHRELGTQTIMLHCLSTQYLWNLQRNHIVNYWKQFSSSLSIKLLGSDVRLRWVFYEGTLQLPFAPVSDGIKIHKIRGAYGYHIILVWKWWYSTFPPIVGKFFCDTWQLTLSSTLHQCPEWNMRVKLSAIWNVLQVGKYQQTWFVAIALLLRCNCWLKWIVPIVCSIYDWFVSIFDSDGFIFVHCICSNKHSPLFKFFLLWRQISGKTHLLWITFIVTNAKYVRHVYALLLKADQRRHIPLTVERDCSLRMFHNHQQHFFKWVCHRQSKSMSMENMNLNTKSGIIQQCQCHVCW